MHVGYACEFHVWGMRVNLKGFAAASRAILQLVALRAIFIQPCNIFPLLFSSGCDACNQQACMAVATGGVHPPLLQCGTPDRGTLGVRLV